MTDKRITEYLLPVRIVDDYGAINPKILLTRFDGQIYLKIGQHCEIKKGGYVVLDYGRQIQGGIRLLAECGGGGRVRIRFGESVGESCSDVGKDGSTNDHSPRDFEAFIPQLSDVTWGQTGFRFVRIDNVGDTDVRFAAAVAAFVHIGEEFRGSFKCSDPLVNKIYDTAAYTVYLNMQNRLWDGIKRDRLVWVGDMHPEVKGILNLFGAHALVESAISESAANNPSPKWIQGMPSYNIWWMAILCDYRWYTGNDEFVTSQLPYLYDQLRIMDRFVDESGAVCFEKGDPTYDPQFLNWETCGEDGRECGLRGLMLWTVRKCAAMLTALGQDCSLAESLIKRLESNSEYSAKSKTVAALYSMGYGTAATTKLLAAKNGAANYSCFTSSYIMGALADMGQGERAIADMKEFYGGMLSRGATSFWESFDTEWLKDSGRIDEYTPKGLKDIHSSFGAYCYEGYRLSLCHGWACGPVSFLSERVLGVRFTAAGGQKVKITPDLMGLDFAEGKIPTKFGNIWVKHVKDGQKIITEYSLPQGVTLEE